MAKVNNLSVLTSLLFELSRIMRQMMLNDTREKLNYFHIYTLSLIKEEGGITMKDLAQLLKISSSTATALIDRLAGFKAIDRKSDQANRKLVRLYLTRVGLELLKKNFKQKEKFLQLGISQLSSAETKAFEHALRKIVGAYAPKHQL